MWKRFIDDIFFLWNGSVEELECFVKELNHQHSHIKFTANYDPETKMVPFSKIEPFFLRNVYKFMLRQNMVFLSPEVWADLFFVHKCSLFVFDHGSRILCLSRRHKFCTQQQSVANLIGSSKYTFMGAYFSEINAD